MFNTLHIKDIVSRNFNFFGLYRRVSRLEFRRLKRNLAVLQSVDLGNLLLRIDKDKIGIKEQTRFQDVYRQAGYLLCSTAELASRQVDGTQNDRFLGLGDTIYMKLLRDHRFVNAYHQSYSMPWNSQAQSSQTADQPVSYSQLNGGSKQFWDAATVGVSSGRITDIRRLMLNIPNERWGLFKRNLLILQSLDLADFFSGLDKDKFTTVYQKVAYLFATATGRGQTPGELYGSKIGKLVVPKTIDEEKEEEE